MNTYRYEEIEIGMTEQFSVEITEKMVHAFTEISGDTNPLHIDQDYAQSNGYPDRVVYGGVTASFYSRLAGVYLPGKYCLFYSADVKFTNPVYVGDVLTVSGKVIEKDDKINQQIVVKGKISNQNGTTVSLAKLVLGVIK